MTCPATRANRPFENGAAQSAQATIDLQRFDLQRHRAACGNDEPLLRHVLPFAGLVRDDDFGHPVVIPAGSVYVTAGPTAAARHALHAAQPDRADRPAHAGAAGLHRPGRGLAPGAMAAAHPGRAAGPEGLRHGDGLRRVPGAGRPLPGGAAGRGMGGRVTPRREGAK